MEREVSVGQLIAGKYRIEKVLGRGGMGIVMAALHEHLNQRVALKFLTDNAYQQPEAVARFVREARAAVQIQSEHVARVMDVGTLDSGAPYMVMEYLRGRDLKDVVAQRGPLPIVEAVDYLLQACDAVAEAHSLNIVHRDLKPSNLFLTERADGSPLVKVLDFGISKALHPGEASQLQMTASAAIMGSPQYMSPEQIRSSKNVDARADVWALGTILHELLAGSPAYVADTVPGLLAMIVADPPPPVSSVRAEVPRELEAAILHCLEKDRERRYPNVAAFARALEPFASSETQPLVRRIARLLGEDVAPQVPAPRRAPTAPPQPETIVQTNGTWAHTGQLHKEGRAPAPWHSKPSARAGLGVAALGALALGWWSLSRSSGQEPADALDVTTHAVTAAPPAVEPRPAAAVPQSSGGAPSRATGVMPVPAVVRPVMDAPAPPISDPATATAPSTAKPLDREPERTSAAARSKKPAVKPTERSRAASAAKPAPLPASRVKVESPSPATPAPKKNNPLDLFDDTK